ncbi:MAG: acetyl-coenzyme A synthetase N-terminal domain-containing protein [Emcibacteraceae bacterium]
MYKIETHPVGTALMEHALINADRYNDLYARSLSDPEGFWGEMGRRLDWTRPYSKVKDVSFSEDDLHIRWYEDGTLNACVNCVDRHLESRGDQTAIIFEGMTPMYRVISRTVSFTGKCAVLPMC